MNNSQVRWNTMSQIDVHSSVVSVRDPVPDCDVRKPLNVRGIEPGSDESERSPSTTRQKAIKVVKGTFVIAYRYPIRAGAGASGPRAGGYGLGLGLANTGAHSIGNIDETLLKPESKVTHRITRHHT